MARERWRCPRHWGGWHESPGCRHVLRDCTSNICKEFGSRMLLLNSSD